MQKNFKLSEWNNKYDNYQNTRPTLKAYQSITIKWELWIMAAKKAIRRVVQFTIHRELAIVRRWMIIFSVKVKMTVSWSTPTAFLLSQIRCIWARVSGIFKLISIQLISIHWKHSFDFADKDYSPSISPTPFNPMHHDQSDRHSQEWVYNFLTWHANYSNN